MDLQRIKRNLGKRSGRTKLTRKASKSQATRQDPTKLDAQQQRSRQPSSDLITALPSLDPGKAESNLSRPQTTESTQPRQQEIESTQPGQQETEPNQLTQQETESTQPVQQETQPDQKMQQEEIPNKEMQAEQSNSTNIAPTQDGAIDPSSSRPEMGITRRKSTRYGTSGIEIFKDGPPTPPKEESVEPADPHPEAVAPPGDQNVDTLPSQTEPVAPPRSEAVEPDSRPSTGISRRKSTRYGTSGIEIFKDEPLTPPKDDTVEPPSLQQDPADPARDEAVAPLSLQHESPALPREMINEPTNSFPEPSPFTRDDDNVDPLSSQPDTTAAPRDEHVDPLSSQPETTAAQRDEAVEASSPQPEAAVAAIPKDEGADTQRPGTGITRRKSTRYGTSGIEIFKDGPPTPPKDETIEPPSLQAESSNPPEERSAEPPASRPDMGLQRRSSVKYGSSGIEIFKENPSNTPRERPQTPTSQLQTSAPSSDNAAAESPRSRPGVGIQRRSSVKYGTSGIEIIKEDQSEVPEERAKSTTQQPQVSAPSSDQAIEVPRSRPGVGIQRRSSVKYGSSGIEIIKEDQTDTPEAAAHVPISQPEQPAPERDEEPAQSRPDMGLQRRPSTKYGTSGIEIFKQEPANPSIQAAQLPHPQSQISAPQGGDTIEPLPSRPDTGLQRRGSTKYGTSGIEIFRNAASPSPRGIMKTSNLRSQPPAFSGPQSIENASARPATGPQRRKSTRFGFSAIEIPMARFADHPPTPPIESNQRGLSHMRSFDDLNFDLGPPSQAKPKTKPPSIESQYELLFSGDHMMSILQTPHLLSRYISFLYHYVPTKYPLLIRYLETQKVIKAIAYANAVIEGMPPLSGDDKTANDVHVPSAAADLDNAYEAFCRVAFQNLTEHTLPIYLTYSLVMNVSELSVMTITGKATPTVRQLVHGLSEVFCLTDPNQEDNPIIYASEEFYRLTRYSQEDVLNYNCRFLQGPRTRAKSVQNLREAIRKGEETSEIMLNYRRDGRAFINLLMIAPLHDDKGKVRYYLGAQVDASGMIDGGKGLDSLRRCLATKQSESNSGFEQQEHKDPTGDGPEGTKGGKALERLRELSEMFNHRESEMIRVKNRSSQIGQGSDNRGTGKAETPKSSRRRFGDPEDSDTHDNTEKKQTDKEAWDFGQAIPDRVSGKLPGVYEAFLLIRPAPSLRIVFVSPGLQHIGKIVQNPFMSHVAATSATLSGLQKSFDDMTPVTAKICFMSEPGSERTGTVLPSAPRNEQAQYGQICWISCTPLKGVDGTAGVWMVLLIDESNKSLARKEPPLREKAPEQQPANVTGRQWMDDSTTGSEGLTNATTTTNHDDITGDPQGTVNAENGPSIVSTTKESEVLSSEISAPSAEPHDAGQGSEHVPPPHNHESPINNLDTAGGVTASEPEPIQKHAQPLAHNQNERVIIQPENQEDHKEMGADAIDTGFTHDQRLEHSGSAGTLPLDSSRSVPSNAQFTNDSKDVGLQYPGESEGQAYPSHTSMASTTPPESASISQVPSDIDQQDESEATPVQKQSISTLETSATPQQVETEAPHSPSLNTQMQQTSDDRPQTPDSSSRRKTSNVGRRRRSTNSTERPISPSSNYKAGGMRLEYVMMPHAHQNPSNTYRGITGGWQVRSRVSSDEDRITDSDECARSPYSVD